MEVRGWRVKGGGWKWRVKGEGWQEVVGSVNCGIVLVGARLRSKAWWEAI